MGGLIGRVSAIVLASLQIFARFAWLYAQHLGRARIELDLGQLPCRRQQLDLVNPAIALRLQLHFEHLARYLAHQTLQHRGQWQHLARLHRLPRAVVVVLAAGPGGRHGQRCSAQHTGSQAPALGMEARSNREEGEKHERIVPRDI